MHGGCSVGCLPGWVLWPLVSISQGGWGGEESLVQQYALCYQEAEVLKDGRDLGKLGSRDSSCGMSLTSSEMWLPALALPLSSCV